MVVSNWPCGHIIRRALLSKVKSARDKRSSLHLHLSITGYAGSYLCSSAGHIRDWRPNHRQYQLPAFTRPDEGLCSDVRGTGSTNLSLTDGADFGLNMMTAFAVSIR